ncbi:MAG: tetratricopeptide repeat protein [Hyphomonadaceae bacterium]
MNRDPYGVPVASASRAAMDKMVVAAEQLRLLRGDPIASLDAVLAEDESCALAWAVRAAAIGQTTDKAYMGEAESSLRAGEAGDANARERAHLAAARAWVEGRYLEAAARWGALAQEHPRDLFALQFAHMADFFLGQQSELRDRPVQALRAWGAREVERGAVLGMAAFGYEECGDFVRAEVCGREACAIEPADSWAAHAVAHVCEMQGRAEEGVRWLEGGAPGWAPESVFAYHNWWHVALFHLDRLDYAAALALYDAKIRPQPSTVLLEMIDASALLWRLHLEGADVGGRWAELAESWARIADDGVYAFNDVHAMMAFLAAGRRTETERMLATLRRRAEGADDNAFMTRHVGLPAAQALADFAAGRYAAAADALHAVRGRAQRFGGSHAQRDLLTLTLFEAARRAGRLEQAAAIAAERLAQKPQSPWARAIAQRAGVIAKAA